jgi:dGTPase
VVDVADEIAYDNHDLDDGITSGLIKESELRGLRIWSAKRRQVEKHTATDARHKTKGDILKYQTIRSLINDQVSDVIRQTESNIKRLRIKDTRDVKRTSERIVTFSSPMKLLREPMRDFLVKNLYHHYRVVRMSNKAYRFMTSLFNVYLDKPEQLPPTTQSRLNQEEKHRVICDYIAGMTDRYALDEYKKFFEPYERV